MPFVQITIFLDERKLNESEDKFTYLFLKMLKLPTIIHKNIAKQKTRLFYCQCCQEYNCGLLRLANNGFLINCNDRYNTGEKEGK